MKPTNPLGLACNQKTTDLDYFPTGVNSDISDK